MKQKKKKKERELQQQQQRRIQEISEIINNKKSIK